MDIGKKDDKCKSNNYTQESAQIEQPLTPNHAVEDVDFIVHNDGSRKWVKQRGKKISDRDYAYPPNCSRGKCGNRSRNSECTAGKDYEIFSFSGLIGKFT